MIKFKEFFLKYLLESPKNTGDFETPMSDTGYASELYRDIIQNPKQYKLVFTKFSETHPVYLYEDRDGADVSLYFVPKNDTFVYGYCTYELVEDGGVIMTSVYNRPMYFGLAQAVYNDYIIPTYKYIMSDGNHSRSGRSFWRKVISHQLMKPRRVVIWDFLKKKEVKIITNSSELDDFYGDEELFERYRIKIYR